MSLCSGEGAGPRRSGDSWELEGTLLRHLFLRRKKTADRAFEASMVRV